MFHALEYNWLNLTASILSNGKSVNFEAKRLVSYVINSASSLERNNVIKMVLEKLEKINDVQDRQKFESVLEELLTCSMLKSSSHHEEMLQVYIQKVHK